MKRVKKLAFTLAETLVALTLIAVLSIMVITSLHNKERQKKINDTKLMTLYSNVNRIYEDILNLHCKNTNKITTLEDINGDGIVSAEDIANFFISEYKGEKADCSGLIKPSDFSLGRDRTCIDLASNGFAAIVFDKNCKTNLSKIKEYKEQQEYSPQNACGYFAYANKESKGIMGEDFFVYPMTNRTTQRKTIKRETITN